jgi:Ser/Thr protein kinase RdoA (MazF antagonist)
MNISTDISDAVLPGPPCLDAGQVANAVSDQFGLQGNYVQLVSERDQNFRLTTADNTSFVVKVTCLAEDPVVTDFQIATLIHLESQGFAGVPRVVRTATGENHGSIATGDGNRSCLRIVTWLSGQLLSDVDVTPQIAQRFGRRLSQLNRSLLDFSHEGENQILLWDSQRAGELRSLLGHIDDRVVRDVVESVLDDFEHKTRPALADLPGQVIHNDANDDNILLDSEGRISGIIDFGDMLKAPRIVEVSTAASYLRSVDDPLRLIEPFVAGYDSENVLLKTELELLFDLIRTRLSMTLIIMYWRLATRGKDDPYRQKALASNSDALVFLQKLSSLGPAAFLERVLKK